MRRTTATLTSFGAYAANKMLRPGSITLQGNNGGWVTIAADQYLASLPFGYLVKRTLDGTGADVDWSAYTAWRATYTVLNADGSESTFTNEAVTGASASDGLFVLEDFEPQVIGPDGQLIADIIQYLAANGPLYATNGYIAGILRLVAGALIIAESAGGASAYLRFESSAGAYRGALSADVNGVVIDSSGNLHLSSGGYDVLFYNVSANTIYFTYDLDAGGNRLTNLATGSDPNDAVNVSQLPVSPIAFVDLTLANGRNDNVAIGSTAAIVFCRIAGPTTGFSISGVGAPASGTQIVILHNTTANNMTILNDDANSTAGNRARTTTGGDLVTSGRGNVTLAYDANAATLRWIDTSFRA